MQIAEVAQPGFSVYDNGTVMAQPETFSTGIDVNGEPETHAKPVVAPRPIFAEKTVYDAFSVVVIIFVAAESYLILPDVIVPSRPCMLDAKMHLVALKVFAQVIFSLYHYQPISFKNFPTT
ncbi:hypothetical protein [Paraprevotella clara]|uniref:hypothetical protein n=2 Tax=Paraprevotella clara TaxID=454154 RepID=UPI0040265703